MGSVCRARLVAVGLLAVVLCCTPGACQAPVKAPRFAIRRVVSQRPASEGAFAPDGRRFVFVHRDRLWLANPGVAKPRRIGAPGVDRVYGARWASDTLLVVNQVALRQGDMLGALDLARGRFRVLARNVEEGRYSVARDGGLLVWESTPRPGQPGAGWAGIIGAGPLRGTSLGRIAPPAFAVPSPTGEYVAGVSHGGVPFLHRAASGGAVVLQADPGEKATAAAWSPDGSLLACLMERAASDGTASECAAAVYRVGEEVPQRRIALPEAFRGVRWDAERRGLWGLGGPPEPGLWYVPVAEEEAPRRVSPGEVASFVPLVGGRVLAAVPALDRPGRHSLFLYDASGMLATRVSGTPMHDHLDDVSADFRKVLLTRRPYDDRQELTPEATLWLFELSE